MARKTRNQKMERVLRLLAGIARNVRARAALMDHGFDEAVFDEGWRLLREASHTSFVRPPPPPAVDPRAALRSLQAWEKRWFPIVRATLERHHPVIARVLFRDRVAPSGPETVLAVEGMVRVIEELPTLRGPNRREGVEARALLARRGMTSEVIAEVRRWIAQVKSFPDAPPPSAYDPEAELRARVEGEARLWAWYREWSEIARRAVTDRRDRLQLGLVTGAGGASEDADDDGAVPAAASVVAPPASPGGGARVAVAAPSAPARAAPRKAKAAPRKKRAKRRTRR